MAVDMGIPIIALEMSTTATGRVIKEVACQQCDTAYVYLMERAAIGKGSSLYFVDNKGATKRAGERAERQLTKRLDQEIDVVPCPECGRVQDDMVRLARKRRLRWLHKGGVLLVIAAATVGGMNYATSIGVDEPRLFEWSAFWPFALIAPAVLAMRFVAARMYDPNADPEANRARGLEWAMRKDDFERLPAEEDSSA